MVNRLLATGLLTFVLATDASLAENRKLIDGTGPGWTALSENDFTNVNCNPDTFLWKDGTIYCTGKPTGVISSKKQYTNYELVVEWRHMKHAGNSGLFVWTTEESLNRLRKGQGNLPDGIEVQVLDLGYETNWEKNKGRKPDWFTSHGDVFPVRADMKPFPPVAPNGKRSFPSKRLSKGVGEWNHYYVSCIDGTVRLSVNGEEVSGGSDCKPSSGYLCLESEGSPVEFRNLRIRELSSSADAELNIPPEGFTALFNGKDLDGWWGLKTEDPAKWMALPADQLKAKREESLKDIRKHWTVENGILINDGHGMFLTTDKNYSDFELHLEYKTVPKADSGIYLRAVPQVQIWDYTEEAKFKLGADKGSGGLWNNRKHPEGKHPKVLADKPFGEWNKMRITMKGEFVTVILNGKTVVDNAQMDNYFARNKPLPEKGPIQLQTHGGEIQWRNVFIREL